MSTTANIITYHGTWSAIHLFTDGARTLRSIREAMRHGPANVPVALTIAVRRGVLREHGSFTITARDDVVRSMVRQFNLLGIEHQGAIE